MRDNPVSAASLGVDVQKLRFLIHDDLHLHRDDGSLAEPLAVALHGVMRSGMKPGDPVLVVGAGAIGLTLVFWARRLGAGKVAVSDLQQETRAMALGAAGFFDADEDLSRRVNEHLGGEPDIVFECVGKPGVIDHCIGLVRPRGSGGCS